MRRLTAALLVVLLALAGVARAADAGVVSYALDNGLQVLLVPDHKVPKVAMILEYRVGGNNEPAGRSGFAHLFEHLMFSGTAAVPDLSAVYSSLGVDYNARTEEDRTIYWASGLASTLPVLLSVEADRMANLGSAVDGADLDLEHSVVLNEMRQKYLDAAGQSGMEALQTGLYPKTHPYSRATVGSIADLDAAELGDVRAFFDRYYVPNNAVLSLSGDFEPEVVKALIAKTFGLLPRGEPIAPITAPAFEPTRIRLDLNDRIAMPRVIMAFSAPPETTDESVALDIVGEILGNYEYGILRKRLVESGIAGFAGAGGSAEQLGGHFIVYAEAAAGVTPEALEAEMRKVLSEFAAAPIAPADVERALRLMKLNDRRYIESQMGKVSMVLWSYRTFGAADIALSGDPRLERIDAAAVERAVDEFLDLADVSMAVIQPGPGGDFPDVLKQSSGTPAPLAVAERPAVAVPLLAATEPKSGTLPAKETGVLSNGIQLVHYPMPDAPMVFVAASATGGVTSEPPGQAGLMSLASRMSYRGAGALDFTAFSTAAKDIGADISARVDIERSSVVLEVPPDSFAAGVGMLADAVQRPRFDPGAWDVLVNETLAGLVAGKRDISNVGSREMRKLLFGNNGKLVLDMTEESVRAIKLADAKAAYHRVFSPATMTIYSAGALPLAEMLPALEAEFGQWTSDSPGVAPVEHPPASFAAGRKVYLLPDPGATQSIIVVARPAPGLDDAEFAAALAVSRVLASDADSRLNTVIREEKGYSYGVGGSLSSMLRHNGVLTVSAPVQADKAGAALEEMLAGFASLATNPVQPVEFERTATAFAASIAGTAETAGSLFNTLLGAAESGFTVEELQGKLAEVAMQSVAAVASEGAALSSTDTAIVLVTGDPATLMPQLAAIGITDVEVLKRDD